MVTTKQIGDQGEDLAATELERVGYKILGRNFRTRFGEIDIIAKDGEVLAFVEVKAKSSDYFGSAGEMITRVKLKKIIKAAEIYLLENSPHCNWRIDAVLLNSDNIEIIKNITLG